MRNVFKRQAVLVVTGTLTDYPHFFSALSGESKHRTYLETEQDVSSPFVSGSRYANNPPHLV